MVYLHQDEAVIVVAVQDLTVAGISALLAVYRAGETGAVAVVEARGAVETLLAVGGAADGALGRVGAEQTRVVAEEVEGGAGRAGRLVAGETVGCA